MGRPGVAGRFGPRRWVAVAVVAGLLAAGCSSSGEGVPDSGPKVGDKPLWDQRTLGLEEATGVEFVGDAAVVTGDAGNGVARLLVVNASDGTPRWLLGQQDALRDGEGIIAHKSAFTGQPRIIGDRNGDWSVLVQYRLTAEAAGEDGGPVHADDEVEGGLAALSGEDGRVLWKTPLLRPRPAEKGVDGDDAAPTGRVLDVDSQVVASDGRHALVTARPRERTPLLDRVRTFAVDLAKGRKLWELTGRWGYQIAGETVLTVEATSTGGPPWREGDSGEIAAVNLATGEERWTLPARYREANPEAAAGRTVVIRAARTDEPGTGTFLLDAETGAERGTVESGFLNCVPDAQRMIVCVDSTEPEITLIDARTGQVDVAAKEVLDDAENTLRVDSVQREGIFVSDTTLDEEKGRQVESVMLDRSGDRIADGLPGSAMAYDGGYAAFAVPRKGDPEEKDDLVVYRVGQGSAPDGPPVRDKPATEPVDYDPDPLWAATTRANPDARSGDRDPGLAGVSSVRTVGDALVTTGPDSDERDQTLQVADLETGKPRWSITDGDPLGGGDSVHLDGVVRPIGAPGEERLLVSYSDGAGASGVAALSLTTGKASWKQPDPADDPESRFALLPETGPEHFLMRVTSHGADDREEIVAFDAVTRRELWRAADFEAETVVRDLVLGTRQGAPAALEMATGEQRWSLAESHPGATLLLGREVGDTVVVALPEAGSGAVAVATDTGEEQGRTPLALTDCEGAGEPLIVCHVGGKSTSRAAFAVNVTVDKGSATFTPLLETTPLGAYRGLDGRMFATRQNATESEPDADPSYLELDAAGRQLADDLPGRPMEVTEDHIVFHTGDATVSGTSHLRFSVHRRG